MVNILITAVTATAVLGTASATVTKPPQSRMETFVARTSVTIKKNKARLAEKAKVRNQAKGSPALRGLKKGGKGKGKGKGKDTILFRSFAGTCDDQPVDAEATSLGVCAQGLNEEGYTFSRKVTSSSPGEPLSLVHSWYEGDECKGDVLDSYDMADYLPPHDGKTYGDCIPFDGGSLQIDYIEGSIEGLEHDAIVEAHASSYDDCSDGDIAEYRSAASGLCYEEGTSSFMYDVTGCNSAGAFYKYVYDDTECTSLQTVINANEANEICKFDFFAVYGIYEADEGPDIIRYRTTFCNNVD